MRVDLADRARSKARHLLKSVQFAAFVSISMLQVFGVARAEELCPGSLPRASTTQSIPAVAAVIEADPADHKIHILSDDATLDANGNATLNGTVIVRQDGRSVAADSVSYDNKTGHIDVNGAVKYADPALRVNGTKGSFDTVGNASVGDAQFDVDHIIARSTSIRPRCLARGSAGSPASCARRRIIARSGESPTATTSTAARSTSPAAPG